MKSIAFIDTEIDVKSHKILDLGGIDDKGNAFHSNSNVEFSNFLKGKEFICGHNIINHDLKYLRYILEEIRLPIENCIDTLHLSALLFPEYPYHSLVKDDKLQTDELNNPLNDAMKAHDLFYDEVTAFTEEKDGWKKLLFALLGEQIEFKAFFCFLGYKNSVNDIIGLILLQFDQLICEHSDIEKWITTNPIELAYCLAIIRLEKTYSISPPWILMNYPKVEQIMHQMRNKPCLRGCSYCDKALNIHLGLKEFFGFDEFRKFDGEALQEKAAQAAIDQKSVLAVFPTGGGKSITFQLPALMSGRNTRGLSIIISPLQSLMKDQVDNLEKIGITEAVTINGLLDPIERSKSIERVANGEAKLLYISPESLRSKTIERLILGRKIVRFIIDEAHCFSSWGQDFRVDYLYIGDFIQSIQEKKNLAEGIPISCFTATAKQKVIHDIRLYFKEKLSIELELFTAKSSRRNLHYTVIEKEDPEEKYNTVRNLIDQKKCPTIIYVSRTRRSFKLAERLKKDGYEALAYHGKMEKQEKSENQDAFISGDVQIMVATSAFGMGVDKKDVGMVIHFDISDSLENYIQEAGRAGRDEAMSADCYVLYNEEDLDKHFILLNQTKLSIKEIQQVWKSIKSISRLKNKVSHSALEIARKAGWDDNIDQIETRVITAIAALENAGYLKRGQNMPRIYASSILSENAQVAIDKIQVSKRFTEKQKVTAVRIIKKLFSVKSRKQSDDETAESRIDYISDHLGIVKEEVINVINLLREEKILADTKDLTAFIKRNDNQNKSLRILENYCKIENFLLEVFNEEEEVFHLKILNEQAEAEGIRQVSPYKLKTIINFWAIKKWIKRKNQIHSKNHLAVVCNEPKEKLKEKQTKRHELAQFIVEKLYQKSETIPSEKDKVLIEFSVHELKESYEQSASLFKVKVSIDDIEDTLFYLSRIEAIKIEGGFLVVYNRLSIERLEQNNKKNYKIEDYKDLHQFYENKVQQIHIVGEYAKRMTKDYRDALQFVEDYFQLNYSAFLNRYFNVRRQEEIKRNITSTKFKQIFGTLSPTQLKIINDKEHQHIGVLAGPGSGKTRVLVHKLASLLLMEDVKHEQLLMVTFSRAAATEFKKRLFQLIGNAALYIEMKTFHSYCFDLLGKVGNLEKSVDILKSTVEKIRQGEVEVNQITKTVLVIDEAQDMDFDEFELVKALMEQNEEMRVIAVGDDDQNIYEFRGASAKYLEEFIGISNAKSYELVDNYRSKKNLVSFGNQWVQRIQKRLKRIPIQAHQQDNGIIKIVRYTSQQLIVPLVGDILMAPLSGSTCILTQTNEEASKITALLLRKGQQAKLIQSNDGFSVYNLAEVRFFLDQLQLKENSFTISEEKWENAKRALKDFFQQTKHIDLCLQLIKDFEATKPKQKFISDFELFIRESKLEDFFNADNSMVFVSTMHKAKGKEFDNVFLHLSNFDHSTNEKKRLFYVAITRAKKRLHIHYNGSYLNEIQVEALEKHDNPQTYHEPEEVAMHLTLKDVWLDYFLNHQKDIQGLKSGDHLHIGQNELLNEHGISVVKFSKKAQEDIAKLYTKGYVLKNAQVNFVLYWLKEGNDKEVKVILPELGFRKESNIIQGC